MHAIFLDFQYVVSKILANYSVGSTLMNAIMEFG